MEKRRARRRMSDITYQQAAYAMFKELDTVSRRLQSPVVLTNIERLNFVRQAQRAMEVAKAAGAHIPPSLVERSIKI